MFNPLSMGSLIAGAGGRVVPPGTTEILLYKADIGRAAGGEDVDGWNDTTALGITNTGGTSFNVATDTFRKLGVIQPANETVYRRVSYTLGVSQSFTLPNFLPNVQHLVRLHCWCGGGSITDNWTMDVSADGVLKGNDQVFNIALDGAIVFEFYHTPTAAEVTLLLTKVATAAIVSGIEVYAYPANRPHNNVYAGYGDSLIWGSDATDQYHGNPTYLAWDNLPQNWSHFNLGKPGWRFDSLIADFSTDVTPRYDASAANNILIINGGVNDLFNAHSVATIKANMRTLCNTARTAGWKVAINTLPYVSDAYPSKPEGYDANQANINADIIANWAEFADHLIDLTAVTELTDPDNVTYVNDGLHYTDAGYALWANEIQTAVETLAGI
jgi:lysophospholipase L1-like esterase